MSGGPEFAIDSVCTEIVVKLIAHKLNELSFQDINLSPKTIS